MSDYEAFTGLPADVDEQSGRWTPILARAVLAILVIGVILTLVLWPVVSADVGALTLSITFAVAVALMVMRQMLLAERR